LACAGHEALARSKNDVFLLHLVKWPALFQKPLVRVSRRFTEDFQTCCKVAKPELKIEAMSKWLKVWSLASLTQYHWRVRCRLAFTYLMTLAVSSRKTHHHWSRFEKQNHLRWQVNMFSLDCSIFKISPASWGDEKAHPLVRINGKRKTWMRHIQSVIQCLFTNMGTSELRCFEI
jgi:hypothetical protein